MGRGPRRREPTKNNASCGYAPPGAIRERAFLFSAHVWGVAPRVRRVAPGIAVYLSTSLSSGPPKPAQPAAQASRSFRRRPASFASHLDWTSIPPRGASLRHGPDSIGGCWLLL